MCTLPKRERKGMREKGVEEMDGQATNMVPYGEFVSPFLPPSALELHFTLWRVHTTRTASLPPPLGRYLNDVLTLQWEGVPPSTEILIK